MVGWGLTEAGNQNSVSPTLKLAEVPVVEYKKCIVGLPEEFKKYVTRDKFCAGYLDKGKYLSLSPDILYYKSEFVIERLKTWNCSSGILDVGTVKQPEVILLLESR